MQGVREKPKDVEVPWLLQLMARGAHGLDSRDDGEMRRLAGRLWPSWKNGEGREED